MERIRSAQAAAAYFRDIDPDTTITESYLRAMMDLDMLPSITVKGKRVTSIEAIERMLAEKLGGDVE